MGLFKGLFDNEKKELKKFNIIAAQIDSLSLEYSKMSDNKLKAKTEEFKKRLNNNETLDDIIVEAFATIREAALRVLGEKPYYVQLLGGLAIHYGNIAEMKTGEGKTLTSIMPAYLNALEEKGVHVITVNDYLAERDANWMGNIFKFLGLTVGINHRELSPQEKQEQYNADITYTTNNELGFDYLRDNMVVKKEDRVQSRGLNFAIVDEVDSVLIDEARTPLIISGGSMKSANLYITTDKFAKTLTKDKDCITDEQYSAITLNEEGVRKAESYFKLNNLYDVNNTVLVHHLNQALRANFMMKSDIDYVVQEDKIIIVDPFTGRLMHGRAYSEGLHQAIEAKEGVTINEETSTLATITFQNLFRMYNKLSGMTGTAKTEEEEFRNIYNMYVIQIPTNKDVIREDLSDLVYSNKEGKYNAIVNSIKERNKTGQPILIGTIAIETSELISDKLRKAGIKHEILNAKNHAREADIIALAGVKNSVTIATNMAGRGTDIKLGDGVKELGGLCIIGTERHESRRIDNQLRGRSGRQGDPGISQFFVSLEDDLMMRFGSDKIKGMVETLGLKGDQAIRSGIFTGGIEKAQKRVEGANFDMRKQVLEYDDVMNKQREIMYDRRNQILDSESIHDTVINTIKEYIESLVMGHIKGKYIEEEEKKAILNNVNENLFIGTINDLKKLKGDNESEIIENLSNYVLKIYEDKISVLPDNIKNEFEKAISLRVIDTHWMEHINTMAHLKEGIGLRGYAQTHPLQAYTIEGFELFDNMMNVIRQNITIFLIRSNVEINIERKEINEGKIYTNDNDSSSHKKKPKVTGNKTGRNNPCPCGSGKKFKQCCGK